MNKRTRTPVVLLALLFAMTPTASHATSQLFDCFTLNRYTFTNCSGHAYERWRPANPPMVNSIWYVGGSLSALPTSSPTVTTLVGDAITKWGTHADAGPVFQVHTATSALKSAYSNAWFLFSDDFMQIDGAELQHLALTVTDNWPDGTIAHTDINFHRNDDDWVWTVCPSTGCINPGFPEPTYIDLESLIVHEMGHAYGMRDVTTWSTPTGTDCTAQTMYHAYNPLVASKTVESRSLEASDIGGIITLYETSIPSSGCVAAGDLEGKTAALFMDVGAFADTAYAETFDEVRSARMILYGFVNSEDVPLSPAWQDTLSAKGGEGIVARYIWPVPDSLNLFQVVEQESSMAATLSPVFAVGTRPDTWSQLYLEQDIADVDTLINAIQLSVATIDPEMILEAPPLDFYCADIVVYGKSTALTYPIYDRIRTEHPNLKVRQIVVGNSNPQLCRNAMASVLAANTYYNNNCLEDCREYPVDPGPELYIVGAADDTTSGVGTASFSAFSAACGHNCFSDYLIYDTNGDGIPDGPVSRIPAETATEATRAARFASEYGKGQYVDPGRRMLSMAGDELIAPGGRSWVPAGHFERIHELFNATGYPRAGVAEPQRLKASEWPSITSRESVFVARAREGVSELYAFGDHSSVNRWPGEFMIKFGVGSHIQFTAQDKKQRMIAWLPGCLTTSSLVTPEYRPLSAGVMFSDPENAAVAAVVGHMDNGLAQLHMEFGERLIWWRQEAFESTESLTVSRVVYNAVRDAMNESTLLRDHALSINVWGSHTYVRPLGVAPVPVSDLAVTMGRTTATISWTEPEQFEGETDSYEIRYKSGAPVSELNFTGSAVSTPPEPGGTGTQHCVSVTGLSPCQSYSFGIRSMKSGLQSVVSNVAAGTTHCSGTSQVMCEDWLMAGGGGGGGSSMGLMPTASDRTGTVAMEELSFENSVLGLRGEGATDVYRIGDLASAGGRRARVWLRSLGTYQRELTDLKIGYLDHGAEAVTVSSGESVFVGHRDQVYAIGESEGDALPAQWVPLRNQELHVRPGIGVIIDLGEDAYWSALIANLRVSSLEVRDDLVGIDCDRLDARGEWVAIGTMYPRRFADDIAINAQNSRYVRIRSRKEYALLGVAQLQVNAIAVPNWLPPVEARHSRSGAVAWSEGARTVMAMGDTLNVELRIPEQPAGISRDYFVSVSGSILGRQSGSAQSAAEAGGLQWSIELRGVVPNPSMGGTTVSYSLAYPADVALRMYDVSGRKVRTLVSARQGAGLQQAVWDIRDDSGRMVPPGVYFCRLTVGDWHSERKVVLLGR